MAIDKSVVKRLDRTFVAFTAQRFGIRSINESDYEAIQDFANSIAAHQRNLDAEICESMDGLHDTLYAGAIRKGESK